MDEFKELYENLSPNKLSIENVTQVRLYLQPSTSTFNRSVFQLFLLQLFHYFSLQLETKVEVLEQEVRQLEAALNRSELDKRNLSINYERDKKNLVKSHESLLANISALFKTAKKEIERKNNTIKELRQQ